MNAHRSRSEKLGGRLWMLIVGLCAAAAAVAQGAWATGTFDMALVLYVGGGALALIALGGLVAWLFSE